MSGRKKITKNRGKSNVTTFNAEKKKADNNLYLVEVIEKVGNRVKIRYTGYGSEYDKWREKKDIFKTATYTTSYLSLSNWMALKVTWQSICKNSL